MKIPEINIIFSPVDSSAMITHMELACGGTEINMIIRSFDNYLNVEPDLFVLLVRHTDAADILTRVFNSTLLDIPVIYNKELSTFRNIGVDIRKYFGEDVKFPSAMVLLEIMMEVVSDRESWCPKSEWEETTSRIRDEIDKAHLN